MDLGTFQRRQSADQISSTGMISLSYQEMEGGGGGQSTKYIVSVFNCILPPNTRVQCYFCLLILCCCKKDVVWVLDKYFLTNQLITPTGLGIIRNVAIGLQVPVGTQRTPFLFYHVLCANGHYVVETNTLAFLFYADCAFSDSYKSSAHREEVNHLPRLPGLGRP